MNRRLLSSFCLIYIALVLYGSLMPLDFHFDQEAARANWHRAWQFWPFGTFHTSRTDLGSNVILYIPLGVALATRWSLSRRHRLAAVLGATVVGLATSIFVELSQLYIPDRTSGIHDVLMNGLGSFLGAVAGAVAGPAVWDRATGWIGDRWRRRPLSLAATALLILLALDALFPLLPTLDVGQVWGSLKASYRLATDNLGFPDHPWHYWLVARGLAWAALVILLGASSLRHDRWKWPAAALIAIVFALAVEAGKPFIVSRTANPANVLVSAAAAVVAMIVGALGQGRLRMRGKAALAVAALLLFIVYAELRPLDFNWSLDLAKTKIPHGAQWLPLSHYAHRGGMEDVHLFVQSIALLAALTYGLAALAGFSEHSSRPGRVVQGIIVGALLGSLLELGQFFLPGRVPSTTDVFCFAVGGGLGVWLWLMTPEESRPDPGDHD